MISAEELEEQITQKEVVDEAMEEKEDVTDLGGYSPRRLTAGDIFPMVKIVKKAGIKDFAKCLNVNDLEGLTNIDDAVIENLGMSAVFNIVDMLLDRIPEIGVELFEFLGDLIGTTGKEVESLPLDVFANLIVEVVRGKEFLGFTKAVLRLVK